MEITINVTAVLMFVLGYLAVGFVGLVGLNFFILHKEQSSRTLSRIFYTSILSCWAFPYVLVSETKRIRQNTIRERLRNSSFVSKDSGEEISYRDLCVEYAESVNVEFLDDESPIFWAIGKQTRIYQFAKENYELSTAA